MRLAFILFRILFVLFLLLLLLGLLSSAAVSCYYSPLQTRAAVGTLPPRCPLSPPGQLEAACVDEVWIMLLLLL